jgi:hypothetical protein
MARIDTSHSRSVTLSLSGQVVGNLGQQQSEPFIDEPTIAGLSRPAVRPARPRVLHQNGRDQRATRSHTVEISCDAIAMNGKIMVTANELQMIS